MNNKFKGKVALVTGGSTGIGKATALAFAKQGAIVVISDINTSKGEKTLEQIKLLNAEGMFVKTDVSSTKDVSNLIEKIVASYGKLDIAYNNAGIGGSFGAKTHEYCEDTWDKVIAINLKGVWNCMRFEIAQMLKQGHGTIVNTSSIWGLVGVAGSSAYVASKHAVAGLTRASALEYASSGIRINAVNPGSIRTPILDPLIEEIEGFEETLRSLHPIGRIGQPEEVANAVLWLSSDESSFVVGQNIPIDGGYTSQ
jgi:NAD(P)-dependent dehydrogenase (short-subunit alcohol dehydrogenase family)